MPRRPSAKQLAKAEEHFKEVVTNYIVSRGAKPGRFYTHELETPAGLLHISVYGSWIATRFDDVAKGRAITSAIGSGCNPYTGKWNFHYFDGSIESLSPERAISEFGRNLEKLMAWTAEVAA